MTEDIARRGRAYLGSYLGLLLGWLGLLLIAAGVALGLRELHVYSATWHLLLYWGAVAVAGTAVVYAVIMFAVTWSFSRALGVHFLPAMAFAIWGAIPGCNVIPLILLLILAARHGRSASGDAQG